MLWVRVIFEFVIGCGLLAWGANRFILACVSLARHFGMPPLLIGMILVGFGTSFPELVVSALASFKGNGGIAVGNAIGSNIANIGLVVGIASLITPIMVQSKLLKREFPILVVVTLVLGILIWDQHLSRFDGFVLIGMLVVYLLWMIKVGVSKRYVKDPLTVEYEHEIPPEMSLLKAWIWWAMGLAILFFASDLLVNGATLIAKALHVSDFIIGLTVVAIGTSLPELAVTVASAFRKEHDIAIGNIIGSNIFNSLAVFAMPALIVPNAVSPHLLKHDYPIMLAFSLVLWLFASVPYKKASINRIEGGILLLGFIGYLVFAIMTG